MIKISRRAQLCLHLLAWTCAACSSPGSDAAVRTVRAGEKTVADTSRVLSGESIGALYGFYDSQCADPGLPGWASGSAQAPSWSILANGGFSLPSGAPPAVLVLEGDSACNLVLTDVILTDGTDLVISGGAGMVLNNDGSYQSSASQLLNGSSVVAYINATTDQPGAPFAEDFNVDIDISDSVGTGSAAGSGAAQSTVTTTGFPSVNGVPAPDYSATLTVNGLLANSSGVVTYANGAVTLSFGSQEGQSYEIMSGDVTGDTFAQLDSAFVAGTPIAFDMTGWSASGACGGDAGVCPSFDISDFITVGSTNLTNGLVDTIVVQFVDANGVATYEALAVTFSL